MSIIPGSCATLEHINKITRNIDNTPLTEDHKNKLRRLLGLLHKTWEEECVLPSALKSLSSGSDLSFSNAKSLPSPAENSAGGPNNTQSNTNTGGSGGVVLLGVQTPNSPEPSFSSTDKPTNTDASPASGGLTSNCAVIGSEVSSGDVTPDVASGVISPDTSSAMFRARSVEDSVILDVPSGKEEHYFAATLIPTKGKLQDVSNPQGSDSTYKKSSNPLHMAAKISTLYKDFFNIRCLLRFLWANKFVPEKAYHGCLNTILWRHQNIPKYWTEDEIRPCVRMRYCDWYGVTKPVGEFEDKKDTKKTDDSAAVVSAAGGIRPAPCVILQLRAHCSDLSVSAELRCKFVLLCLEKGFSYMRSQYHRSQTRVLDIYKEKRPNEPFVFIDEKPLSKKEQEKADKAAAKQGLPSPPAIPKQLTEPALKVLEKEILDIITEAQIAAAAKYNSVNVASGVPSPSSISASPTPLGTLAAPLPPQAFASEEELIDGPEQMILLMDETNSTSDKMDTKFLRFLAPILFTHCVERLRYCIVVNPTLISTMCVNIIKLVVDERTKSKIKLFDIKGVSMDEFLAETKQTCPGRAPPTAAVVAAAESSLAAQKNNAEAKLSDKDKEKKEKELQKEKEKRAKNLDYEDMCYPCPELIELLGVENVPMKYGGRMPPVSANEYESWFHAVPPFADASQREGEEIRDAVRNSGLKK